MGLLRKEQIAGMNCHYYNYSLDYFMDSMEMCGYETVALWGGAPHFYLGAVSETLKYPYFRSFLLFYFWVSPHYFCTFFE